MPNADGSLLIFGDEDTAKFSTFLNSEVGGVPSANKIGAALFGPQPVADFLPAPSQVTTVAANFGCNAGDFAAAPGGVRGRRTDPAWRGLCICTCTRTETPTSWAATGVTGQRRTVDLRASVTG